MAIALHRQGRLDEAEAIYKEILHSHPAHFEALQLLATLAAQQKNFSIAVGLFDRALKINASHPGLLNNRGVALKELKRYDEALVCYEKAIALKPDYADAYSNRGAALKELKRYEEALESYDRAIALKPDYAVAYYNRGNALQKLQRYEEAVLSYAMVIAQNHGHPETFDNRGNALMELKRHEEALESYDRAIALKPDYAVAYYNRGNALQKLQRYEEAVLDYQKALALKPDYDFILGQYLHAKMKICDWRKFDQNVHQLAEKIARNKKASLPFPVLALLDSISLQKKTAEIYTLEKFPSNHALQVIPKREMHEKIRIGYFSADFHEHPVMHLMAGLFETHNRERFELVAFSFGPDIHDDMNKRVSAAFDRFIDVRNLPDIQTVLLSRSLEIDIAIDLGGFTTDSRTGIFALRAAPVQVNYLGYPGTMGSETIDYLIADATLIPESNRRYYTEKIAYLPHSYMANDDKRRIADKVFTREELNLPETGFVFCCFNNNYKITPDVFKGWMRILRKVEGSVLWLFENSPKAAENLRRMAALEGIDRERLIFATRMANPEHLARHRSADLFLDTLPYNAHTTASDALWAGVPVLTCIGESFASRVAASLLNAVHLPELITSTRQEYEALAIELAANPEKLAEIREKLERNRLTTPLFDTGLFTRNIEKAYTAIYGRYKDNLPPDHIVLTP